MTAAMKNYKQDIDLRIILPLRNMYSPGCGYVDRSYLKAVIYDCAASFARSIRRWKIHLLGLENSSFYLFIDSIVQRTAAGHENIL